MIILFNDTSEVEANPGCALTVAGLVSLLGNHELVRRPLGYGYDQYRRARHQLIPNFLRIVRTLVADRDFRHADTVIINGEGTIHHEEKGAHVLLMILAASRLLRKRVLLVNCSIQALSRRNLRLLRLAHSIYVREIFSQAYLSRQGIASTLALDCAFLADCNAASPCHLPKTTEKPICIFTPGVLLEHRGENEDFLLAHYEAIVRRGFEPVYLQVQEKEAKDVVVWSQMGGRVVRRSEYQASQIFSVLRTADLVISGRYHIIIFALMVGTPFEALDTNTWKIGGLLDSILMNEPKSDSGASELPTSAGSPPKTGHIDLGRIRDAIVCAYKELGMTESKHEERKNVPAP